MLQEPHIYFYLALSCSHYRVCMMITVGVYNYIFVGLRLLLWCLMPLSTIFQLNMWQPVLFVKETEVPGENNRPVANH